MTAAAGYGARMVSFIVRGDEGRTRVMDERVTYEDPSEVDAIDGAVKVQGPDAVDVLMTPEAAEETSERLEKEAVRARGQRRLRRIPHQPKD